MLVNMILHFFTSISLFFACAVIPAHFCSSEKDRALGSGKARFGIDILPGMGFATKVGEGLIDE